MYCKNCGKILNQEEGRCANCGNQVDYQRIDSSLETKRNNK